jgi:predicted transcriptional regulator YdeE
MEPRFVEREAFWVVGVEDEAYKIEEVDPGFDDLWMNRFMAKHDEIQPFSVDGAYYGVWFGTQGSDLSSGTYLAGMAVEEGADVPEGWSLREVPAATYAVFDTTLRDIGEATEFALDRWLPGAEYRYDGDAPRFDYMPPDTSGPETPVSVWIPVIGNGS